MEKDYIEIADELDNEVTELKYSITSYGADYDVDGIVKRMENETIFVPPFQRNYVWDQVKSSKFIESLILGLPVPGIFLSTEPKTNKLLIIDGQQRLLTLYHFFKGYNKKYPQERYKDKDFKLKGVQQSLIGKTYNTLDSQDRIGLENSIIHSTIIRQDTPSNDESSIYLIFERLNSGGTNLNSQEIRACLFYGKFNELLNELVNNEDWRLLFEKQNQRSKEPELILRFFALYYNYENYKSPLKLFLNGFIEDNRNLEIYNKETLNKLFSDTIHFIWNILGKSAYVQNKKINAAVFDAVSVGLAKRLEKGNINNNELFKTKYNELLDMSEFVECVLSRTSNESSVKLRIDLAIKQFEDIE